MSPIRFDTYYRYAELAGFLEDWAQQYPNLCRLESIGQSYEGRDILAMTITNFATGPDNEKPAYWVDGNIHATEVSASSAALYLIHMLLTKYGTDPRVTYALESRAFYVVPRLGPDGAEMALADKPKYIRSSTRPYPREDALDGLHQEDIDGDGRILQMRLRDPNGSWKVYAEDPRLLIPREADDLPGGEYYRLLSEGLIQNYDGVIIKSAPPLEGLDLNRQFPVDWSPAEHGAGQYPASEPEPQAAVRFVVDHPNITGCISFHTFSGVHLRPSSRMSDDAMITSDLHTFRKLGEKGTEISGYPAVSVYHDFKYDPKDYIKGTFDDWMYEHRGVYSWTTEIWSVQRQAGITEYKYLEWFRVHPLEDDLTIMRWNDEVLGGKGYVNWYPFEHPQLGPVELGGWDFMYTWRNPPHALLEKEIAPLADFALYCALASPKLELHSVDVSSVGDVHRVRLVVQNTGWLPTQVSEQGLKAKVVRDLEADILLPEGAQLLAGTAKQMLGQLRGRDDKGRFSSWGNDATSDRAKAEWVVQAPSGTTVEVVATHQRAGVVRHYVTL